MWTREVALWKYGSRRVAGVDEAGRGPLAGPVVAAAVVLPGRGDRGYRKARKALCDVRDSKQLSEGARDACADAIRAHALAWGVGLCDVAEIDRLNILRASLEAMRRALEELGADGCSLAPDFVLVDGNFPIPDLDVPQEAIVGGDALCVSIAAASILAKVHRDKLMADLHARFPAYGFDRHKGYPTAQHLAALAERGPCEAHRRSFKPVRDLVSGQLTL
ncbi:MAG: ribonuclease HII [Candidatus Sericytochromatia bacterium]|nr:ribonuclease HII [Candidatus Tanganyikabacteria bacterium]